MESNFELQMVPLVDESMAISLAAYGARYRQFRNRLRNGALLVGMAFGCFLSFSAASQLILILTFVLIAITWLHAQLLTVAVVSAFRDKEYALLAKLMDRALLMNAILSPLTYSSLATCGRIQSQTLMIQSRGSELEALMRICWATTEKETKNESMPKHAGVPSNHSIANDLACAYLIQRRFQDAAKIFQQLLDTAKSGAQKKLFAINLAVCYVGEDKFEEAENLLNKYSSLGFEKPPNLKLRAIYLNAVLDAHHERYHECEQKIEECLRLAAKQSESREFVASIYRVIGRARAKQERWEEAVLHYHTAIDLMKMNDDPAWIDLASALREYASILAAMERDGESASVLQEAETYEAFYVERESRRMDLIRQQILAKKMPLVLTKIVNMSQDESLPAIPLRRSHS